MLDGWLNIDKPLGVSSAYVVRQVKKLLLQAGAKVKVGHCGTLDPAASGVLPIAIGEATKLSSYVMGSKKTYVFTIQFGAKTDTADKEGGVIETTSNFPTTKDILEKVASEFVGKYMQRIPAYSAAKLKGKPFYLLARQGLEVPERSKLVEIFALKLMDCDLDKHTATYEVECSKGSYVRTLAEDISSSLQTLGFVIELKRIKVSLLAIEDSAPFSALEQRDALSRIKLLETESLISHIPSININLQEAQNVLQGKQLYLNMPNLELLWLAYDRRIVSIGQIKDGMYHIFCNFNLINKNVDNS